MFVRPIGFVSWGNARGEGHIAGQGPHRYDGRVYKTFRGPKAEERFANEVRVLRHLEKRGCAFVPRLLASDPEKLSIVTSSCGHRVDHLDAERMKEIYSELEDMGSGMTTRRSGM